MSDDLLFQQQSMLELLRTQLDEVRESAARLDDKAQQNIGVSSVIVAIVSALQLGPRQGVDLGAIGTGFLIAIFLVYAAVFLLSYYTRVPRYTLGYPPDTKDVETWLSYNEGQYFSALVNSYRVAIESHQMAVRRKVLLVRAATILIGVDVLLIFLAVIAQQA